MCVALTLDNILSWVKALHSNMQQLLNTGVAQAGIDQAVCGTVIMISRLSSFTDGSTTARLWTSRLEIMILDIHHTVMPFTWTELYYRILSDITKVMWCQSV